MPCGFSAFNSHVYNVVILLKCRYESCSSEVGLDNLYFHKLPSDANTSSTGHLWGSRTSKKILGREDQWPSVAQWQLSSVALPPRGIPLSEHVKVRRSNIAVHLTILFWHIYWTEDKRWKPATWWPIGYLHAGARP